MRPECGTCQKFPCMVAWMQTERCPRWDAVDIRRLIQKTFAQARCDSLRPTRIRMKPVIYDALWDQLRKLMDEVGTALPRGIKWQGVKTLFGLTILVDKDAKYELALETGQEIILP